jgi:hypothetical protein
LSLSFVNEAGDDLLSDIGVTADIRGTIVPEKACRIEVVTADGSYVFPRIAYSEGDICCLTLDDIQEVIDGNDEFTILITSPHIFGDSIAHKMTSWWRLKIIDHKKFSYYQWPTAGGDCMTLSVDNIDCARAAYGAYFTVIIPTRKE